MRLSPRRLAALFAFACAWFVLALGGTADLQTPFVTQPYLQLGSRFADGSLSVVWHAPRQAPPAVVEWRYASTDAWAGAAIVDRLDMSDRTVFEAALAVGRTGRAFEYRVRSGGAAAFTGRGTAPAPADASFGFAVIGDGGDGGPEQRALAARLMTERAAGNVQLVILAGDLVYDCGQREEYDERFFPVYNGDAVATGVPLMRDVPFAGAVGNHDVGDKGFWLFDRCAPDYSYFAFWKHPAGFAAPLPITRASPPHQPRKGSVFAGSAMTRVLTRATFSFDWGGAHFVVLDSNKYVDWADKGLVARLEQDLSRATAARWRFVVFHHPPFNLSGRHEEQQWMRVLAPVFERYRVSVVFAGHVHNFQWFGPATFAPDAEARARFAGGPRRRLPGVATLQQDYDGAGNTRATAPVYIVSGAGGHGLKDQAMQCPEDLVPRPADCTRRAVVDGSTASATIVSVAPDALRIRQVGADGRSILTRTLTGR